MKITWKTTALVFAGGALGTLVRSGISSNFADIISLALVNIIGSAVLGWLNGDSRFASEGRRAFWSVGFSGGFTTMSGIALFTSLSGIFSLLGFGLVVLIVFALSLLSYWVTHQTALRLTRHTAVVSQDIEDAVCSE